MGVVHGFGQLLYTNYKEMVRMLVFDIKKDDFNKLKTMYDTDYEGFTQVYLFYEGGFDVSLIGDDAELHSCFKYAKETDEEISENF